MTIIIFFFSFNFLDPSFVGFFLGVTGKNTQLCGLGCTVDKKEPLYWKEMLELSSSSTGINSQNQTSDRLALGGVPSPPAIVTEYEADHRTNDETSLEHVRTTPQANILISTIAS